MKIIVLALLAFAPPVAAQSQAQFNLRADDALESADAELNAQWRTTYAAMKQRDAADTSRGGGFGYAAATLASQRAWIAFRDKQCVIEGAEFAGGSMQPMTRKQCLTRLTRERTAQLKAMVWQR